MRNGFGTLPKVSKTWGFCSSFKNVGRRGTFAEDLQRCISRGGPNTRDIFFRDVGRSGRWFLRRVVFSSIKPWGFLRWFCVTSAALRMAWPHFFVVGAVLQIDVVCKSQNGLVRGRQLCTQLSIFKGRLAELLRFWCCQLRKLRKSRRIAAFFTLSRSKN